MHVTQQGNNFLLEFAYNPRIITAVKSDKDASGKPYAKWNGRCWVIPVDRRHHVEKLMARYGKASAVAAAPEQYGEIPPMPELEVEYKAILAQELLRMPYHYQEQGIAYNLKNKRVLNGDDMGGGKKLINGTLVLTASGWKAIETLQPGYKVYGADGNLHTVTGVYPHPAEALYKVTFSDNTSVIAGLDHLWAIRSLNDRKRAGGKWRVADTAFIKSNLRYKNGSPIWEIPLCAPINYPEKELLIPPYILGVLIADGALQKGIRFVPGDIEVPGIVGGLMPAGYRLTKGADYGTSTAYYISHTGNSIRNPWIVYLRSVALNVSGEHKYIPTDYLNGSIDQRKALLAGLLDCDGESNGARCRYSTGSLRLAENVVTLVQSLGGLAVISTKPERVKVTGGKESREQTNYIVSIRLSFNPFGKESARSKWKVSSKLIRQIVSIEPADQREATCIAVDAPDHLYVIKDHIVTHNTTTSICTVVAAGLKNKCGLVVCKGSGKFMWEREFKVVAGMKSIILGSSIKDTWYQFYQLMGISVFITNYESLEKFFVDRIIDPGKNKHFIPEEHIVWKKHPILGVAMKDLFHYVILDESHEIRNEDTMKSIVAVEIGAGKEYRMALSGTPVVNKAKDIYQQLKFLGRTKNTKEAKKQFMDRYCGGNGSKSTNMKELHYKLSISCYFRRNTKEFGIDLPELTLQMAYADITNRREYDHANRNLRDYLVKMKGLTDAQVEKSMNAEAMVLIGVQMNIAARGKLREAIEEIDNALNSGNKIVVFINQKEIKDALIRHYPQGLVISGEENSAEKNRAEQEFNTTDKIIPIFVSIKAGGVGINLQSDCQHVLFLELPWHPAFYYQCVKRVHRNGVKGHVISRNLLGKNTIDERIWEIIESKKDIADTIAGANDDDIKREIIDKIKESLFNTQAA